MKNILTSLAIVFVLASCNDSKKSLCDCVEKGAKVDAFAQDLLVNQNANQSKKDSLDLLLAERDEICKDFIDIPAEELEKERSKCEGIQIRKD